MPDQILTEPVATAVIVASTRQGRFADTMTNWLVPAMRELDPNRPIDVIDLAEFDIPVDWRSPTNGEYTVPDIRRLSDRVERAQAFVFVTPEYNHSYPASLKVALDALSSEWSAKPAGFVAYGGASGGLRAVEHLRLVLGELHMVAIRNSVSFNMAWSQFDPDGSLHDPKPASRSLERMLRQLDWWSRALQTARSDSPYIRT